MAQVTAEQLFARVRAQATRIAELELINEALTVENAELVNRLAATKAIEEQAEARNVAAAIVGKKKADAG